MQEDEKIVEYVARRITCDRVKERRVIKTYRKRSFKKTVGRLKTMCGSEFWVLNEKKEKQMEVA